MLSCWALEYGTHILSHYLREKVAKTIKWNILEDQRHQLEHGQNLRSKYPIVSPPNSLCTNLQSWERAALMWFDYSPE
jgi:hypothetical protein